MTLDRASLAHTRNLQLNAGVQASDSIPSSNAKLRTTFNKTQGYKILDIRIRAVGIKGGMPIAAENLEQLQIAIGKFYNANENYDAPGVIGYTFADYTTLFYFSPWEGYEPIFEDAADILKKAVSAANNRLSKLYKLKENVSQALETKIFQDRAKSLTQSMSGLSLRQELISDPHNRYLDYLYARLEQIDEYLSKAINYILDDIFLQDTENLFVEERRGIDALIDEEEGEIPNLLQTIQSRLIKLSSKALLYVSSASREEAKSEKLSIAIPQGTSYFWLSTHLGRQKTIGPIRVQDAVTAPLEGEPLARTIEEPTQPENEVTVPLEGEPLARTIEEPTQPENEVTAPLEEEPPDPDLQGPTLIDMGLGWEQEALKEIDLYAKKLNSFFKTSKCIAKGRFGSQVHEIKQQMLRKIDCSNCHIKIKQSDPNLSQVSTIKIFAVRREIDLGFFKLPVELEEASLIGRFALLGQSELLEASLKKT